MPTGLRTELFGRAVWEREETLDDPDTSRRAARHAGLDVAALHADGPSDAELDALHAQFTARGADRGVFGAPSFVLPSGGVSGSGPAGTAGARV